MKSRPESKSESPSFFFAPLLECVVWQKLIKAAASSGPLPACLVISDGNFLLNSSHASLVRIHPPDLPDTEALPLPVELLNERTKRAERMCPFLKLLPIFSGNSDTIWKKKEIVVAKC
ncbi:hypothetical protein AVEN_46409-1 [Araneus ventricosus]|uniref:Uncharacterized protein n=1 Tax=Araneus ventricosus TaxID=182803 RepID=A0A4Y2MDC5_ARAVE|nr:hypothetical protein AVEN_46409-1 [Araneus ventricosus]